LIYGFRGFDSDTLKLSGIMPIIPENKRSSLYDSSSKGLFEMRIDGPSHQHRIGSNHKKDAVEKDKSQRPAFSGDSVELSGRPADLASLRSVARQDDTSRTARLEEVRQRLSSGYYNTEQFRSDLADAVSLSGTMNEVVVDSAQIQELRRQVDEAPDSREGRIEETRKRVAEGYYDQRSARLDAADRLIDDLI
jgi:anti-sigma28 factor (negative regulator of flagellin synthesis)